jgi:Zn-dependent protease
MLVVPLLTAFTNGWAVGWASTPYDPQWAARHPRRAAIMAAAGPAGNLLIAAGAFVALKAGLAAGIWVSPDRAGYHHLVDAAGGASWLTGVGEMLTVLLVLNVLLFVFNMLPFPPLDGASAIGGLLPKRAAGALRALVSSPAFSLLGIFVAWQIFPAIARPLFRTVLQLLHPGQLYS